MDHLRHPEVSREYQAGRQALVVDTAGSFASHLKIRACQLLAIAIIQTAHLT
jgi:hypothetical protein